MAKQQEFNEDPETTAYHANKRELLRRGLESGELTWTQIRTALPEEHLSDVELEVFLFTCKNMGIEIKNE